jgi:hypothetical protein
MSDDLTASDIEQIFEEEFDRVSLLKRAVVTGAAVGLAPWIATSRAFAASRTI